MAHYSEMDGYPQEQFGENSQMYCERKLKCAWADRYAVLMEVAGNGGQNYPYKTDMLARANGAGIMPFGKQSDSSSSPIAVYDYAIITVKYSTTTAVKLGSAWVTEELQPTSRLINVNMAGHNWIAPGSYPVVPADNIVKLETAFDYVVTYYHLTGIPVAAYANCNKVNSGSVASWLLGLSFDPETLLYPRPIVIRTFDPGILSTFRLTYRFGFRPATWNKHLHTNEYYATTADPIYKSFNFASLMP
uniref:Uncharacterized protein n=1 Tax=viral metagenome TaxID=1070528 RepID=A0A6M3IKQ6_9ZZZZ